MCDNKYKFQKRWDEDTNIGWWKTSRIELNLIINHYNYWQIEDEFDSVKARRLLALIEHGKQTIGVQDGGSGYMDCLEEMENFVKPYATDYA